MSVGSLENLGKIDLFLGIRKDEVYGNVFSVEVETAAIMETRLIHSGNIVGEKRSVFIPFPQDYAAFVGNSQFLVAYTEFLSNVTLLLSGAYFHGLS